MLCLELGLIKNARTVRILSMLFAEPHQRAHNPLDSGPSTTRELFYGGITQDSSDQGEQDIH